MTAGKKELPDFFDDTPIDPVGSATGKGPGATTTENEGRKKSGPEKKKAGFYLSAEVLDRFDRKFHELKLAGKTIGNKSNLLEAALGFALDDMDKGEESCILERF